MDTNIKSLILNILNESEANRIIPKNVKLSVASTCSRKRSSEAEFVQPIGRLQKDELLDRYVAALIVMKKPCPQSEEDIEKLKTFKYFGEKAIKYGATIEEIKTLYDANAKKKSSATTVTAKPATPVSSKDPEAVLKQITQKIPQSLYKKIVEFATSWPYEARHVVHNVKDQEGYKLCKDQIDAYLKDLIARGEYKFEKIGPLIQKEFKEFEDLMGLNLKSYIFIDKFVGYGTWRCDCYYFYMWINKDQAIMRRNCKYNHRDVQSYDPVSDAIFKNLTDFCVYDDRDRYRVNLLEHLSCEMYANIISYYIYYLIKQERNKNKGSSAETLKKYDIVSEHVTFDWLKKNIKNILFNNPDYKFPVNYSDYQGTIHYLEYKSSNKKYYLNMIASDADDDNDIRTFDWLDELLNSRNGYEFDEGGHYFSVDNLDDLADHIYQKAKKLIEKGVII